MPRKVCRERSLEIHRLAKSGASPEKISNTLHLTIPTVLRVLSLPAPLLSAEEGIEPIIEKPMPRTCLRCGKTFSSKGAGNRICRECDHVNANDRSIKTMPEFNPIFAPQRRH